MLAVKPGAMDAGDAAVGVGHRREQPRPGLADRVTVGAIPERRMKAQRRPVEPCGDAARAQIGFGMGDGDGPASAKQTAGRFGRSAGRKRFAGRMKRLGTRQAEEATRLVEYGEEGVEPAIEGGQNEKNAMHEGGGVGPFAGGRSEEHTSELQSLMRHSYAVF